MALPESVHLSSLVPNVLGVSSSSSSTIAVPDDYPSISAAIGNASLGDTIIVHAGTYFENPVVDKQLTLQGENSGDTVVVGVGGSVGASVFKITADNVKVSGFTIKSVNYSASASYALGINIEGNKCMITGNNIVNTLTGIFCSVQSSSAIISHNNITENRKNGILIFGGFNNTISENNITGNVGTAIAIEGYSANITGNNLSQNNIGIGLEATYSVIFKNNITNNRNAGIYLSASNDVISANTLSNNKYGIYSVLAFGISSNNTITHNNFVNNHQNAYSTSSYNIQIWDEGYPLGGNYWSDYSTVCPNAAEIAKSGIMNSPYTICDNNTDNNPLSAPFSISNSNASPNPKTAPAIGSNHVAAFWSFDNVEPNGVTFDATEANPAVLAIDPANASYTPQLVEGKYGKALDFNGASYAYAPSSPSLDIPADITVDAWVKVAEFKNVTYNNIVIESVSTTAKYQTRVIGLSITGAATSNSTFPAVGSLRGYVTTDTSGFNEIVTNQPVIALNEWTHVTFIRSVETGMHLYVNGVEQNVTVTAGTQNPGGSIMKTTGLIFGHDSVTTIDDVRILNTDIESSTPIWQQWWFWIPIAAAFAALVGTAYYIKKHSVKRNVAKV